MILPQTDTGGALKIALDIKTDISNLQIEHKRSRITKILSISIGVSSLVPMKGDGYSVLIESADTAMYSAKANGRNRIESS